MKIKGHAKIELIDAETGVVKRTVEQDNTVTGAATEYFRDCGKLLYSPLRNFYYDNYNASTRLIDKLFGGIMLFDKNINGNSDLTGKYNTPLYCPAGVTMVGNGTTLSFTDNNKSIQLGTYDSDSSERSENTNETKRTYIYEWPEGRGEGDIGSICLTTPQGGWIGNGAEVKYNSSTNRYESYYYFGNSESDFKHIWDSTPSSTMIGTEATSSFYATSRWLYDLNSEYSSNSSGIAKRCCTIELEEGSLIYLSKTPEECLSSGEFKLQWYNLPIKKVDPFYNPNIFNPATSVLNKEITINIHDLANSFPSGGLGNLITAARVISGINYILLVGCSTPYPQNNSNLYVVKLYREKVNNVWEWRAKYLNYNNLLFSVAYPQAPGNIDFSETRSNGIFRQVSGGLLDDESIPVTNPYYNGLVLGGYVNSDYEYYYVIKQNTTQSEAIFLNVPDTSTSHYWPLGRIYHPSDTQSASGYNTFSFVVGLCYIFNGKVYIGQSICWDPVLDKLFIINARYDGGTTDFHSELIPCFDSYHLVNIANMGHSYLPYLSALSMLRMPCNWLSTISNLPEQGSIHKGPNEKLRITYTLEFDPTA